jgi:hypothetical protein
VQLVARVFRLFTSPAVVFGSFVQAMVGFCDAPLARAIIGAKPRCSGENESSCQRRGRKRRPSPKRIFRTISHFYSALLPMDYFLQVSLTIVKSVTVM